MCLATPAGLTQEKANFSCPPGHCFSTPQRSVPAADRSCLSCLIEWIQPHIIGSRSLSISVWHTGYWTGGCSSYPASLRPWVSLVPALVTFWCKHFLGLRAAFCSALIELVHIDSRGVRYQVFEWNPNKRRFRLEGLLWFSSFPGKGGDTIALWKSSPSAPSCTPLYGPAADWLGDWAGAEWTVMTEKAMEKQVHLLQPCSLPIHPSFSHLSEISFCFFMYNLQTQTWHILSVQFHEFWQTHTSM